MGQQTTASLRPAWASFMTISLVKPQNKRPEINVRAKDLEGVSVYNTSEQRYGH
jgi:hypothetical protein